VTDNASPSPAGVPAHLPRRLAICYYGWDWFTSALPDEPYGDLARAMAETRERGFNCVRPDMGLGLLYDWNGDRRGPIEFAPWIPGASENLHCVNGRGGGVHDVFDRVMLLFDLAARHDLYIIGTSWLYQDFVAQVADPRLRAEILGLPYNDRIPMLARQWDQLLTELERRGLADRLAMAETVNEVTYTPVYDPDGSAPEHPTPEDWVEERHPAPNAVFVKHLCAEAVEFVRERHPDVLVTQDLGSAHELETTFPDSAQVADHHVYTNGLTQALYAAVNLDPWFSATVPEVEANEVLRSLLKPDVMPWDEFCRRADRVRATWRRLGWLYHNIDNRKFDDWCLAHFEEYRDRIRDSAVALFGLAEAFARKRNLPLVVDEGYIFYPPLGSRFVTTPQGRWGEEVCVDAAIETGHWGVIVTGYFRPNTPVWHDDDQCDWVRGLNRRILAS
jgi:hypothetical protein